MRQRTAALIVCLALAAADWWTAAAAWGTGAAPQSAAMAFGEAATGERGAWRVEVTPALGTRFGMWGEYLYHPYQDYLISYLDWRAGPVPEAGVDTRLSNGAWELDVTARAFFPLAKCGTMRDHDWAEQGMETNYSVNDLYSGFAFSGGVAAAYAFTWQGVSLCPTVSVEYSHENFTARDGYGRYGDAAHSATKTNVPYTSTDATYYPHISGYSTYRLHNLFTFAGLRAGIALGERLTLCAEAAVSPWAYTFTRDDHYRKTGECTKYALAEQNVYFGRYKVALGVEYHTGGAAGGGVQAGAGKAGARGLCGVRVGAECMFGTAGSGYYEMTGTVDDGTFTQVARSKADVRAFTVSAGLMFAVQ